MMFWTAASSSLFGESEDEEMAFAVQPFTVFSSHAEIPAKPEGSETDTSGA